MWCSGVWLATGWLVVPFNEKWNTECGTGSSLLPYFLPSFLISFSFFLYHIYNVYFAERWLSWFWTSWILDASEISKWRRSTWTQGFGAQWRRMGWGVRFKNKQHGYNNLAHGREWGYPRKADRKNIGTRLESWCSTTQCEKLEYDVEFHY